MAKKNRSLTQQITLKNPLIIFLIGALVGWGANMVFTGFAAPKQKVSGSGTCVGNPNPTAVGGTTIVSASNLSPVDQLWFRVHNSEGTGYYGGGVPDANGNASAEIHAYITGEHSVEVSGQTFRNNRATSQLLAKCSYMVQ